MFHRKKTAFFASSGPPAEPGQVIFTTSTTWTVPAGVFSISLVCVQQGGDTSTTGTDITIGGTVVCRAKNGARIGDGGGEGGLGGAKVFYNAQNGNPTYQGGSGGGAGGYSGNGGAGGAPLVVNNSSQYNPGSAGSGGGAGGGYAFSSPASGGGVGLLGQGASGAAGDGLGGSGGANSVFPNPGAYGGGRRKSTYDDGEQGGALSYKNVVPVTPGQAVTINIPNNAAANGAVRVMWGGGRSYPNNAGNA